MLLPQVRAQCLQEWRSYVNTAPAVRAYESLMDGHQLGKFLLPHPAMFHFSEFAWHSPDFFGVLRNTDLAGREFLRIGEFGAGLSKPHERLHFSRELGALDARARGTMAYEEIVVMVRDLLLSQIGDGDGKLVIEPGAMVAAAAAAGVTPAAFDVFYLELLRRSALEVYGALGGMNLETRELLLLFLGGGRPGEIHVFDSNADLRTDLERQELAVLKLWKSERWPEELQRKSTHYLTTLGAGRSVRRKSHADGRCRLTIESESVPLTDAEMRKIHLHPTDIFLAPLPETEPFDLTVFLQAYYFCPPAVGLLAWAEMISRTKIGGYLLSDADFPRALFRHAMKELGLRLVHETGKNLYHEGRSSGLYQRVRETPAARELASVRKTG